MSEMALPFDISRTFNDETFSDVTIEFSGRRLCLHKLVLCQASDYFNVLCGPTSKFVESKQTVIELQDDDPDAVEVMLRYFYNGTYESIIAEMKANGKDTGFALQMAIFVVGKKYMIAELEEKGRVGVRNCISETQAVFNESKDAAGIFSSYCFLSEHRDQDDEFRNMMIEIGKTHLPDLFAFSDFRKMLEEDEHKESLDIAVKAVKRAYEPPQTVEVTRSVRRKMECYSCGNEWYTTC